MIELHKSRWFFTAWKRCFQSIRHAKTFLPFVGYAVLQFVLLLVLVYFTYPPFASFLIPVVRKLYGEAALHYPNNFLVLPSLYAQFNLVLSGIVGIVVIGIATKMFEMIFKGSAPQLKSGVNATFPRYGQLFVVWLVETVFILLFVVGLPLLLRKHAIENYQLARVVRLGCMFLGILVGALFAYTSALIILDRKGIFGSIARSLSIFRENAISTFFLIAIPTLLYFPINYVSQQSRFLVTKFNPEIVGFVLAIGILVSLIANYLMVGTVTMFYLWVTGRREY
ncbi:hypothetical protein J7K19_06010 [bacterium]|nr:hypothetical protein [bacterium]